MKPGIYCCDAMEGLELLPDNAAELILTDIPYGEVNRPTGGIRKFDKGVADDAAGLDIPLLVDEFCRVSYGSIYVFCGTEQVSSIRQRMVSNGLSTRLCIWEKTNPSPVNGQHLWLSGVESCVFGRKSKATFNEHCKNSVWRFPNGRSKAHPTEKPLALFTYLVEVSSQPGSLVVDPFIGSGTTAKACLDTGRMCIGFDTEPEYVKLAKSRLDVDGEGAK